jgi:hypothetical protein
MLPLFDDFIESVVSCFESNLCFAQVLFDLTKHISIAPKQHGEFPVVSEKEST